MRRMIMVSLAGAVVALAACSREEAKDTGANVRAAAGKVGDQARDAANSPEVKQVGSEIKEAAKDAGHVIKGAAKGAVEGGREAAAKVEGESKDAAHDAKQ